VTTFVIFNTRDTQQPAPQTPTATATATTIAAKYEITNNTKQTAISSLTQTSFNPSR